MGIWRATQSVNGYHVNTADSPLPAPAPLRCSTRLCRTAQHEHHHLHCTHREPAITRSFLLLHRHLLNPPPIRLFADVECSTGSSAASREGRRLALPGQQQRERKEERRAAARRLHAGQTLAAFQRRPPVPEAAQPSLFLPPTPLLSPASPTIAAAARSAPRISRETGRFEHSGVHRHRSHRRCSSSPHQCASRLT